jgi:VWFA-related protein
VRGTTIRVVPLTPPSRLLVAAIFAAACVCVSAHAQQPAPFRTATNTVIVPVVVVDKKGVTVPNLAATDFTVTEDGKPVEITTFLPPLPEGAAAVERFIVLALDNLVTDATIAWRLKGVARRFVDRMGPRDIMSVVSLNGGHATTTNSKTDLIAAIDKFKPYWGDGIWLPGDKARHALSMLGSLSEQISEGAHQRKIVVVIGSPWLFVPHNGSGPPELGVSPEWMEAVRSTSRNNVAVYVVDPAGLEGPPGEFADWAHSFAADTGGAAWTSTNNFGGAADRIWRESASFYLLGYAVPVNDGRIHRISVKVAKPGVTVRARKARG